MSIGGNLYICAIACCCMKTQRKAPAAKGIEN